LDRSFRGDGLLLKIIGKKVVHWLSLFLGVLIAVFIAALIVLRTDFFSQNITRMVSRNLFHRSNFSLHIGRFEGNIVKGMNAKDIFIRYSSSERSFDFLRAEEIKLRYNLLDLLRGKTVIDTVIVVNPHVWIKPDSIGRFIIPSFSSGGASPYSGFRVSFVKVTEGQIIFQGMKRADFIKDIWIEGSVHSKGDSIIVDIFHGSGVEIARDIRLQEMSGRIGFLNRKEGILFGRKSKREVFIDDLSLSLEESNVVLNGKYDLDSTLVDVSLLMQNIDIEEISRILKVKRELFGELSGRIDLSGTVDSLRTRCRIDGLVKGYECEGLFLETVLHNRRPGIVRFSGRINRADIEGKARFVDEAPSSLGFEIDFENLNLANNFFPGSSVPSSNLKGTLNVIYKLDEGSTIFNSRMRSGSIGRVPFEVAIFNGAFAEDTLKVDELFILHDSHNLKAYGSYVLDGGGKLYLDLNCNREDILFELLNIDEYRANLVVNGVWEGDLQNYNVFASGHFTDLLYHAINVPSGSLKLAVNKDEKLKVQVDISSDTCIVMERPFNRFEFSLKYYDGVTDIKKFRIEAPDKSISLSASIRSGDEGVIADMSNVNVRFLNDEWVSGGRFRISVGDSVVLLDDVQLHSRSGAVYLDGRMDRKRETVDAAVKFNRLNLSLLNSAGMAGYDFSGVCEGRMRVSGMLADPSLEVELHAREVSIDTIMLDSVSVAAGYSKGKYSVDSLSISSNGGSLIMETDISGVTLKGLVSNVDSSLSLLTGKTSMHCKALDLRPVRAFVSGFPITEGYLSGSIEVKGSLIHPELVLKGYIDELKALSFNVPRLSFESSVKMDTLSIEGKLYLAEDHYGTFRGNLPLKAKRRFYGINSEGALQFNVEFSDGEFVDLARATERFADASGKFSMVFRAIGTVGSPHLYGEFNLKNVSFRIAGMEENFRDVSGRVLLDDTVLTVYELYGSEGKKGSFKGSGNVVLRSWRPVDYNLGLRFEDFFVGSIPDVMAIVSGELHIDGIESGGKIVPDITGSITVKNAELYYELGSSSAQTSQVTFAPPSWLAAVDIEMPGNVWIKTPDARIELQGAVTLYHDNKGNYLRGELELIRGWYNVYNSKFKITTGKLSFATAEGFRPIVDIEAETTDPDGRRIFLTIRWHQDDIEPRLSLRHEDPGYSETDIWKMLGGGVVQSPGGEGTSWDAVSTAQNLAANYIERLLNSQMQGVTVEVETRGEIGSLSGGKFPEKEMVIAIGKYLSQGLYVKYKQGLSITSAREIDAEYRISRFFLIRSEIIRYSEKVLRGKSRESTDEINLDIRLRLEFW